MMCATIWKPWQRICEFIQINFICLTLLRVMLSGAKHLHTEIETLRFRSHRPEAVSLRDGDMF
jgi:hypothetical protein